MPGPMGGPGPMGPGKRGGRPGTPGPMTGAGHEKADLGALKKIVIYCKRYLPAIAAAFIFATGSTICTICGPQKISDLTNLMVNGLMTGINLTEVSHAAVVLICIYAASGILGYGQQFITATVTQRTSHRLRRDIVEKINRLPLRFFDSTTKGDFLSRVTNDVDIISQTLSSSAANLISSAVLFLGVLFEMFRSNWVLALITIASSLLGFAGMSLVLGHSQKYFNAKQKDLGVMDGQIEEVFTNHQIVKAFGATEKEQATFAAVNERLYESNWKSQFLSGMMPPFMGFVGNLAYAMIFIVGVALIVNGSQAVTLGTIMAFVIYAKLFSQPLSTFAQAMTSLQQASAASKRVFEILESEEMPDESGKTTVLTDVKGHVEFDNVRFGYSPDKTIIHGFSANLQPGQKVAIVGPTGAGKTTIVNLLMRFYDTDSGIIRIDGVPTINLKRENVHDLFDMILQDTWLFEGTIRENLVYNKPDVTEEQINTALDAVGLSHFVSTLPKGIDTELNSTLNLSEGQKQQLTIARAIIKDAPLLILDEATSSVDTRTELVIQSAMDALTEHRTSFVIAHRLSTIKNADVILVLKDGDIIEQGTHTELLAKGGFYAELYNSQFAVA